MMCTMCFFYRVIEGTVGQGVSLGLQGQLDLQERRYAKYKVPPTKKLNRWRMFLCCWCVLLFYYYYQHFLPLFIYQSSILKLNLLNFSMHNPATACSLHHPEFCRSQCQYYGDNIKNTFLGDWSFRWGIK